MNICFTASRLMRASEVREVCAELRNNPTLLMELELAAKEKIYRQKEKAAS
jgi:hypothetical protein